MVICYRYGALKYDGSEPKSARYLICSGLTIECGFHRIIPQSQVFCGVNDKRDRMIMSNWLFDLSNLLLSFQLFSQMISIHSKHPSQPTP